MDSVELLEKAKEWVKEYTARDYIKSSIIPLNHLIEYLEYLVSNG